MIYDIFYISKSKIHSLDWLQFRQKFPTAQKIENVKDFEDVKIKALTKFFYVVWDGTEVLNFNFDFRISEYDYEYIHVWKTLRYDEETYQGGIALFPKNIKLVSSREFANKFYLNKKEIQKIASKQIYPIYTFKNYEEYKTILENTAHDMFWYIPNDVEIINSDIFNLYFDANNGKYDYDRNENHVFKNNEFYDGVVLFSKNKLVSEKEFKNRFFISKKEHDIVVSKPLPFEVHNINTYEAYLNVLNECKTNMFWVVWSDIELTKELTYHVPYYDQHIIHVFKNNEFYDGVVLFPKNEKISKKEFDFRFYKNRKEIDMQMSVPKPYDIFFISYNEPNADENYKLLCNRFPKAKRIHGVEGIHNAHKAAAENSETEMVWVVDGDAIIEEDFNFEVEYYPHYDSGNRREFLSTVRVWFSKNPINDLIYGYGGVKLLPTKLTLEMNLNSVDMTTSISDNFKVVSTVSNITAFNTDPFNTWKSAFRECAKLSSKVIDSDYDPETDFRLGVWCSKGEDALFGKYAIGGAIEGRSYGYDSIGDNKALQKINDFEWLKDRYEKWLKNNEQ
jgi:hypothetical protein